MKIEITEILDEQLLAFDMVYLKKLKEELADKERVLSLNIAICYFYIHQVQEYEITICEECYNAIIKQLYILEKNNLLLFLLLLELHR